MNTDLVNHINRALLEIEQARRTISCHDQETAILEELRSAGDSLTIARAFADKGRVAHDAAQKLGYWNGEPETKKFHWPRRNRKKVNLDETRT